ncbi:MAG TPA: tRNA preQ1(34) S-adenosylmethionine ribosyltransferase-isomerase QueA, partial [Patescibacteria group bacterium]|nr:tRNA preQ1(34) S-adenosylmethionine ribosyltransferase-isomerase QueA [Patescibacteria group bacterium]
QQPAPRRDASRLMLVPRQGDDLDETTFATLPDRLRPGDLVVLNETRVVPARLRARKPTGGQVELLVLDWAGEEGGAARTVLLSTSKGLRPGVRLSIAADLEAEVIEGPREGRARVLFRGPAPETAARIDDRLRRHGAMPVPPYVHRDPGDPREGDDRERYQTVYAARDGAVAAPTAGLHFTPAILDDLARRGVGTARLVLHVGPGTFLPVRAADIEDHHIEPERFVLPREAAEAIAACRRQGGRVVAVGTTVTRVLEARADDAGGVRPGEGWCDLYIRPGHRFRVVDALLTNLHLPRSSLLILVAAFAGRERILAAYHEAVRRGFRFYSYGDAMLIT